MTSIARAALICSPGDATSAPQGISGPNRRGRHIQCMSGLSVTVPVEVTCGHTLRLLLCACCRCRSGGPAGIRHQVAGTRCKQQYTHLLASSGGGSVLRPCRAGVAGLSRRSASFAAQPCSVCVARRAARLGRGMVGGLEAGTPKWKGGAASGGEASELSLPSYMASLPAEPSRRCETLPAVCWALCSALPKSNTRAGFRASCEAALPGAGSCRACAAGAARGPPRSLPSGLLPWSRSQAAPAISALDNSVGGTAAAAWGCARALLLLLIKPATSASALPGLAPKRDHLEVAAAEGLPPASFS